MPTWCACSLSVKGSEDQLKLFYENLNKPNESGRIVEFCFYQTVPCPSDFHSYSWNDAHWGTK